jgi:VIT1/CCC1 family predicted Fe2+/Mn2+ transporter
MAKDIIALLAGLSAIVVACVGKNFLYVQNFQTVLLSGKRMPIWLGRMLFLVIGVLFLVFALRDLFLAH